MDTPGHTAARRELYAPHRTPHVPSGLRAPPLTTIDLVIMNKTENPSHQNLSKVRSMLDFVLEARGNTCGIGSASPDTGKINNYIT